MGANDGVIIRDIIEGDLAGLVAWYGVARKASFRQSLSRSLAGEVVYLVALAGGDPVGHFGVDFAKTPGVAYLWQGGVRADVQGRGIGTRLIAALEERSVARGLTTAEVNVGKENSGARRLYERLGYAIVGEEVGRWSYNDERGEEVRVEEDEWVLRKALPPSSAGS